MCQPPYSVLKPLRYKVGGPSEVFASSKAAVFCAGMNPLSLKDLVAGCLTDARCLPGASRGLGIAAKGYLESFSINMFLRKRVLPRM